MRIAAMTVSLLLLAGMLQAQDDPFQIELEPVHIEQLPGIQSYAFGVHNGLWLIIGGRIDGLHRRQPWATFNADGKNNQLLVVDPRQGQVWTSPLSGLSEPLQDQLSSTNMQFYQDGHTLYLTGGYGYSQVADEKITFAMMTAVDVAGAIRAIQNQEDLSPYFRMLTDMKFAVAGGQLHKIYDTYYLVGGHRFEGNYNPMNHPTFIQEYTNAVRRFEIDDDGQTLTIRHLPEWVDTASFHRRDFNVGPQILPNGEESLMSFSGPFQLHVDLPYLDVTVIDSQTYATVPGFAQYFNNYHCAHIPLYEASTGTMHTVFFGGIAQYYEHEGQLIQDNDVPFVKTITRITRVQEEPLKEFKLPVEMPDYLGAGAEFIPHADNPKYSNGVIKLDSLSQDRTPIGYIFGGIKSNADNIFWVNDGTQSEAHDIIYQVILVKEVSTQLDQSNQHSHNGLQMQVYPNPTDGIFNVDFHLNRNEKVVLTITNENGKVLLQQDLSNEARIGFNHIEQRFIPIRIEGIYFVTLQIGHAISTQKIIAKE